MKYIVKIDPNSIKKISSTGEYHHFNGRTTVTRTVQYNKEIDGMIFGHTELYRATGVDKNNILINPFLLSKNICNGRILEKMMTEIDYNTQTIYVGNQPKFTYNFDYLPTMVKCDGCECEFLHTELKEKYDNCEYYTYDENIFEGICPKCDRWRCCDIEFELLTDAELEKRMTNGINQVVIE